MRKGSKGAMNPRCIVGRGPSGCCCCSGYVLLKKAGEQASRVNS